MKTFIETKAEFPLLPIWYTAKVHKEIVQIMTIESKLYACKYLRDLSNEHKAAYPNTLEEMNVVEAKNICDFISPRPVLVGGTSIRIIMMSHLSDLQTELGILNPGREFYMHSKLNFVKWLITRYSDTNTMVDADAEWCEFYKTTNNIQAVAKEATERYGNTLTKLKD